MNELILKGEALLQEQIALPAKLELDEAVQERRENPADDCLVEEVPVQCGLLWGGNLVPLLW